jgi:hypothetical protein
MRPEDGTGPQPWELTEDEGLEDTLIVASRDDLGRRGSWKPGCYLVGSDVNVSRTMRYSGIDTQSKRNSDMIACRNLFPKEIMHDDRVARGNGDQICNKLCRDVQNRKTGETKASLQSSQVGILFPFIV